MDCELKINVPHLSPSTESLQIQRPLFQYSQTKECLLKLGRIGVCCEVCNRRSEKELIKSGWIRWSCSWVKNQCGDADQDPWRRYVRNTQSWKSSFRTTQREHFLHRLLEIYRANSTNRIDETVCRTSEIPGICGIAGYIGTTFHITGCNIASSWLSVSLCDYPLYPIHFAKWFSSKYQNSTHLINMPHDCCSTYTGHNPLVFSTRLFDPPAEGPLCILKYAWNRDRLILRAHVIWECLMSSDVAFQRPFV